MIVRAVAAVLTQRSLIEVNEGNDIWEAIVTFFGSTLNQAKRIAPKRQEPRGPKSDMPASVPVRAKVRFHPVPTLIPGQTKVDVGPGWAVPAAPAQRSLSVR